MSGRDKTKKIKRRRLCLAVALSGLIALNFVNAPPPLNPDTTPLPRTFEEYHRGEEQTYLTFPEWYLVYMSDEYARFIKDHRPSAFPYFGYIGQFWSGYWNVYKVTSAKYPFNAGYHVMVMVIGTSTTIEYGLKGIYENTLGRLAEWLSGTDTQEDRFAAAMAADDAQFIRVYPWYEYDFAHQLRALWSDTDTGGKALMRKLERKLILSIEYGAKSVYGWVIKKLTYLSYEPASPFTVVEMTGKIVDDKTIRPISNAAGVDIIAVARYDAFKNYAQELSRGNAQFKTIAGNNGALLLTVIANEQWHYNLAQGKVEFTQPILIEMSLKRVAITVPVTFLSTAIHDLGNQHIRIEHIYDY